MPTQPKPTIKECREQYWKACSEYHAVRVDEYSTYWQLRDAAAAVSRWRKEWVEAVARSQPRGTPRNEKLAAAIERVSKETGEDPGFYRGLRSNRR